MNKIEFIELITEANPDYLDFLPGNVRNEIDKIKEKIDEVYENSEIIKKYQIPQYSVNHEILMIKES